MSTGCASAGGAFSIRRSFAASAHEALAASDDAYGVCR